MEYIRFLVNVSVVMGATGGAVGGGGGGGGEDVSNGIVPVSGTAYSYAESGKIPKRKQNDDHTDARLCTVIGVIKSKLVTLCIACENVGSSSTFGKNFNTSLISYEVLESVICTIRGFS